MAREKDEVKVFPDSPEAATFKTVEGWVSRDGFFYGQDERIARYAGSTHTRCVNCGSEYRKNAWCENCRVKRVRERFEKYPVVEWDGMPLNLFDTDTYFFDEGDIDGHLDDVNWEIEERNKKLSDDQTPEPFIKKSDLKLVVCVPQKPGVFDPNDEWCDFLAEDGEVQDDDVLAAVDALNTALKKAEPFSWLPGDKRVILKDPELLEEVSIGD